MSTRRAEAYQFDHGAQYFSPKTEAFSNIVEDWCKTGLCSPWEANHCTWNAQSGIQPDPKAAIATRYVGTPSMNAICKGLLENVDTKFSITAAAMRHASGKGWTLKDIKSGKALGDFDFLICSDKTAAANYKKDLDRSELGGYIKSANAVSSVQGLVIMVATEGRTGLPFDSLLLDGHPAFSWIARDDSKPGRTRTDASECWVLQSCPSFNATFFATLKNAKGRPDFRAAALTQLVPHFHHLLSEMGCGAEAPTKIVLTQGHRWGGAFPTSTFAGTSDNFYLDEGKGFAAIGDYFTEYPARVEGGWISGDSLARALLDVSKFS